MLRSAYGCCSQIITFLTALAGCSAVTFAQAPLGATLNFEGNVQFPAATVILTVSRPGQTGFTGSNGKVERGTPLFSTQVEPGATFYPCDTVFGFPQPVGNYPSINRRGASSFIAIKETTNGTKKVWINASVGAWRISGGFTSDWEYQIRYYSGDTKKNEPATITAGIIPNAGFYGGSAASGTAEVKFPDLPDLLGSISKRDLNFANGFRPGSLGTISMKLLNNSPVAALGTIDVGFYLSKDPVWDPAIDVPLGVVTLAVGELGPGVVQEVTSLPLLVPSTLPTNNFYILAPIDISRRVEEFIETNNTPYLEMEYFTVTGTVKDRETEKPLGGVDIRLTTGRAQSNAKGEFSVRGLEPGPDDRLILSKKGYEELQLTVNRPTEATSSDQGEILMPLETDLPVVMQLKADLSGFIFIQDVKGLKNLYTVSIKWKGHQPNAVEFSNDRGWKKTVSTTDDTAWVTAGIEETFTPSLVPDFNRIEAVAITKDGQRSKPLKVSFFLVPMPRFLIGKNILPVGFKLDWVPPAQVGIDFEFPRTQVEKEFDLPLLGRSGVSFKFNGGFDYWMNSGRWKVEIGSSADGKAVSRATRRPTYEGGVRTPPLRVYIGKAEVSGSINANFGGTATISEGITFDNKFKINGILKGKAEVGRFGLVPMLGVNADVLKQIPFVYGFVKNTSIAIWLKAGMQGSADIQFRPEWDIQKSTWAISLGVEAVYQPKLPQGEFKVLVGGDGTLSYEPPNDASGQSVKSVRMRAYVSLEAKLFTYAPTWEFIWIDHTYYPFGKSFRLDRQGVWHELQSGELRPASREYLKLGSERFVFSTDEIKDSPDLLQILNNFAPRKRSHLQALAGVDPLPLQADLTLVQNVYPQTQLAMAADRTSGRIMLLYTADPGTAPSLQRTDVRWILWDGTAWTEPRSILDDARGEFSPVVAWDGNGDAIAVWQRIRDAAFAENDLSAMAAQMEIVWSRWDHLTGQWSEPDALTDNAVLDTRPMLCGPMADGDLLLTWTRNGKNRMPGGDGPGEGDLVLATRWDSETKQWQEIKTLVEGVAFRASESLAGSGTKAIYAWVADDSNPLDQEQGAARIRHIEWNGTNWSAPMEDGVASSGLPSQAVVTSSGDHHLFWVSGENLVMASNGSGNSALVQSNAASIGLNELTAVVRQDGRVALLWQEMSATGTDIAYRVLDPASSSWSKIETLTADPAVERGISAAWDAAGNLVTAYAKVQMGSTNKTIILPGGGTTILTNVPQSGRVDLAVSRRSLGVDLAILPGDLRATGFAFLPGESVDFQVTVRNLGDLPATNVGVGLFDGDPANGGILITNISVSGPMIGRSSVIATNRWVVPEPARVRSIFAVADPKGALGEWTRTNNVQNLKIGQSDLTVDLVRQKAGSDSSLRVVVQVANSRAPGTPATKVQVARKATPTKVIGQSDVPPLEPGRTAQIVISLPEGTQPEGESSYIVTVDPDGTVMDFDLANNQFTFSSQLWLDSDKDGIPDKWELANHLGVNDPTDAARDDDQDGLTNLEEYRAGTDPADANSYLHVQLGPIELAESGRFRVTWGSVSGRLYTLERSANIEDGFEIIARHLQATSPQNTFEDQVPVGSEHYFYRIRVE